MSSASTDIYYTPSVPFAGELDVVSALTELYGRSYRFRRIQSSKEASYFIFDIRNPTSIMPGLGDWVAELFHSRNGFKLCLHDLRTEVPINAENLDRRLITMEQQRRLRIFLTPLR